MVGNQKKNEIIIAKNLLEGKTCQSCDYKEEEYYEKKKTDHLCFYGVKEDRSEIKAIPKTPKENTCEHWKKFDTSKIAIKLATMWSEKTMKEIQEGLNADTKALASDWAKIGEDFKAIMGDWTKWSSRK